MQTKTDEEEQGWSLLMCWHPSVASPSSCVVSDGLFISSSSRGSCCADDDLSVITFSEA